MSMAVDFSTPLSDEERKYLEGRGKLADIERADNAHGITGYVPGSGDSSGLMQKSVVGSDVSARRKAELEAELEAINAAEREAGLVSDDETDDVPDYTTWRVEELRTELTRRELSSAGSKAELVKRLEEDDAAYAAQESSQA